MSNRLISLAAGVVLDVGPAQAIEVAAQSGWPSVGIWYDPATWTTTTAAMVRGRLDDLGMIALDIEPIMLTPTSDHGDAIIDAAIEVGARHVLVASRDSDESRVADRLSTLADRLVRNQPGTDITIVLEFLPALGIKSLVQAARIVASVGHQQVAVLIDSLHLSRVGESPADVNRIRTNEPHVRLPYIQIADAPAAPAGTDVPSLIEEALHGRLLPGDGALPLHHLLTAVPDVAVSVELRSRILMTQYPDPVDRARVVREATERTMA
jgi:sugar phosphate isomerase/epimerase